MAVKLLDKDEWTKDGRKWIFYDYVKNLDGSRRKYKSKKVFTKTEALKAEREFLADNILNKKIIKKILILMTI